MAYGVKLELWGDYASFNRPEMKVERVSYDTITPSAARGILEAIYWKPQIRWVIDELRVLKPIRFTQVRRNEIAVKIPERSATSAMKSGTGDLGIAVQDHRQQRAALVLVDVRYGVSAHIEVLDRRGQDGAVLEHPEAKHLDSFRRRAERGQYFHHPYFGTREFPAFFRVVEDFPSCPAELVGQRDLGFILHDIAFLPDRNGKIVEANCGQRLRAEPRFFRATMIDGVIQVPALESARA